MPEPDDIESPLEEIVPVRALVNPAFLVFAKSLLLGAGFPFYIQGERVQDFFGWGSIGTGFCLVTGPPILFVVAKDADAIRELLEDADEGSGSSGGTLVAVILVLLFVNVESAMFSRLTLLPFW